MERFNRQKEITVHNFGSWGNSFRRRISSRQDFLSRDRPFGFDCFAHQGTAISWISWCRRSPLTSLFLTVPFTSTLYKAVCAALTIAGVPSSIDHAEYIELCLAFGFASFGTLSLRRQKLDVAGSHRACLVGRASRDIRSRSQPGSSFSRALLRARAKSASTPREYHEPRSRVSGWVALTPGRVVANVANAWEALLCSLDRFNR